LTRHLDDVRRIHEADLAHGFRRVVLPFALDRKFPNAATEWRWQFVFPAGRICRDPRFGPPSRYHLHESVVQQALVRAVRPAGHEACRSALDASQLRDALIGRWV
jgi:hypothetical protein